MGCESLENLVKSRQLVKVFWTEATGEQRIKKGHIIGADADFIQFKTRKNNYLIHKSSISSMKVLRG